MQEHQSSSERWKDDRELFDLMRTRLFSAVVGDILDKLGYEHQFLPQAIKPIDVEMVIAGRAMTVLEADYFADAGHNALSRKTFGLLFEAIDDLREDEVYVATGASLRYALWGGLTSTRASKLCAAGAILDGFHRDTQEILDRGFPTFSRGSYAQDQAPRGKVVDWRVPVELGGVRICPGDIVFGDRDGVLVVPRAVESQAIVLALEKVETESKVRVAIEAGMSTVEVYEKFGVM
ncbi:demethylmenaquinone methyltransferase family protein [Burkholderia pseudomallei MSHR2990]|uniref:RraA family protein n=1 Tax=Burkholderia pseudomallei TaxID=28450 RepID=UPI000538B335|nr:RraA family protein [Burkholderia pseudomallei]KGW78495.1 demethylmenaquinone methyltransferase family protein [Burkholderia pseudomallei MSHR2990]